MKTETIETQGIRMRYASFGEGPQTLIIIPGLSIGHVTDFAAAVEKMYRPYIQGYTVYLIDRRDNIYPGYSVRDMADDTATVMKALGIENADLFGASQGGMIVMYLAALYPELVRRIVLGSTAAEIGPESAVVVETWSRLARADDRRGLSVSFTEYLYSEATRKALGEGVYASAAGYTAEQLAHFIICDESLLSCKVYEVLDHIACPALVIGCKGDRVFGPEPSERIAQRIRGGLYLYGPEYGHAVFDEAPDYVSRVMAFFNCEQQ